MVEAVVMIMPLLLLIMVSLVDLVVAAETLLLVDPVLMELVIHLLLVRLKVLLVDTEVELLAVAVAQQLKEEIQ